MLRLVRRIARGTIATLAFLASDTLVGSAQAGSAQSATGAAPIAIHRDAKDPRWVIGQVLVDAAPAPVFSKIQQVDAWPQMLTDIRRMHVTEHHDSHWKIELEPRTLPYGMLPYEAQIGPGRTAKIWADKYGIKVVAQTQVAEGPTPNQSLIVYSMRLEVSGIAKTVFSEQELQQKQDHMVAVTLADLRRAFPAAPQSP